METHRPDTGEHLLGRGPNMAHRGSTLSPVMVLLIALALCPYANTAHAQTIRQDLYVTNGTVNSAVLSGGTLYIGGSFTQVGPATGGGVPIDATSGTPVSGFPKVGGSVLAVAPDGSGGWYIGGSFTTVGGVLRSNLAHVLADHTVSPWGPNANGPVAALAVCAGTVYAGGEFTSVGGQVRHFIAALDGSTGNATNWDPNAGGVGSRSIFALAVSGTTVYVGGSFDQIGGQTRFGIAALDAMTGLPTEWNPNAVGTIRALAVSGNTVYVGGSYTSIGGLRRNNIAALNATTGLATAWNPNASAPVLALASSGTTIYAGGSFTTIGGRSRNCVAALDAATGFATWWNPNASGTLDVHVSGVAASSATVYVGGLFTNIGGQARNCMAALDAITGLATPWNPNANDDVRALALSGSTVYVGGTFGGLGGQSRNRIAALDVATGLVTAWDPGADDDVDALAVRGSTIYAGGLFNTIGKQARSHIAALDAATGLATSWNPSANEAVYALAISDTTIYAGGNFTDIGGQARNTIAALDGTTGLATPWNPNVSGAGQSIVYALAVNGTTIYASGGFTSIGGQTRNNIAALDMTSGLATPWNPNAVLAPGVYALAVNATTIYAGGRFNIIGRERRNNIAALDATTGFATTWNPVSTGTIRTLAVSGTTIYVGGRFSSIGGRARNNLAALDAATGFATAWDPNANADVRALAVDGTTVYAGGSFTTISGLAQRGIVAIGDDTTPTQVSLVSAVAHGGHVRLVWFSAEGGLDAMVYRRTERSDWLALRPIAPDGTGRLIFEDTQVVAGTRYGYRLAVTQGDQTAFFGETWVDVPSALEFSLAGPRPSPAFDGLTVAFALPNAAPARLELIDLVGRRMLARDVGELGAGSHVLNLARAGTITPGVYFLRLTQGRNELRRRAVVIR